VAKLFVKYNQTVLKELPISQAVVTIGRLPDNTVQLDNPAVSSYHAKIYWDRDHYVIEDTNSLNGTYLNSRRITRVELKDGDSILIGKHTLVFASTGLEYIPGREGAAAQAGPGLPRVQPTQFLDTKMVKDMLTDKAKVAGSGAGLSDVAAPGNRVPALAGTGIGTLSVLEGKTDQKHYLLTSNMSAIGKSAMASIKLKGWFAPEMASIISKSDKGYFIAASEKNIKVKVNGEKISGKKSLSNGDTIEVAGVKMIFAVQ
jgi:pSer/pThr/pTyr-binding forkhead associated (FHA) protein